MLYSMLDGQILCCKGDFQRERCLYMIIEGSNLGGMCHFWGDPNFNSITILFDVLNYEKTKFYVHISLIISCRSHHV